MGTNNIIWVLEIKFLFIRGGMEKQQGRYFKDYHPGKFMNQQTLCESISQLNTGCLLQTIEANPLTIRLLVSEDAVSQLSNLINDHSTKNLPSAIAIVANELDDDPFRLGLYWGTALVFDTSGSGIAHPTPYLFDPNNVFSSRPLPTGLRRESHRLCFIDDIKYSFPLVNAHIAIYNYFSNFGSILDRFSIEINNLYTLGVNPKQLDWGMLVKNINSLRVKDQHLTNEILKFSSLASNMLEYRNRLVHDGLIPLRAEVTAGNRWAIYAPDYPGNPQNINIDVLSLCRNAQNSLIQFIDNCYGFIIMQLRSKGQPPW